MIAAMNEERRLHFSAIPHFVHALRAWVCITEGKATLLLKLATLEFGTVPDDFHVKLRAATDPELDSRAERLLLANSIEEMLSAG